MPYSGQDTIKATIVVRDSTPRFRKFTEIQVDSIFKKLERREQMMDSIARAEARARYFQTLKPLIEITTKAHTDQGQQENNPAPVLRTSFYRLVKHTHLI